MISLPSCLCQNIDKKPVTDPRAHRNASLTETGRLRLARCVAEGQWPLRRAAERFQVSVTTAARWADRYRHFGEAGMIDRSSRPRHSPNQTPRAASGGSSRSGSCGAGAPPASATRRHPTLHVHRVLTRCQLVPAHPPGPGTAVPERRYEHPTPGDLVYVDIKKLGNIPDGGGRKVLGRAAGRRDRRRGAGYALLHNAVDDHSRLA